MIFTVIQSLPLIEEEVAAHKIELNKSENSADKEGGTDTKTDSDEDTDTLSDIFLSDQFLSNYISLDVSSLPKKSDFIYTFQLNSIQSPPPKV